MWRSELALGLFATILIAGNLCAHGDLHERIDQVTRQIAETPGDARLYLTRAELYKDHGDLDSALKDCDSAAAKDPALGKTDLLRADTLLLASKPQAAVDAASRFLTGHPSSGEAFLIRARALSMLELPAEAAPAYSEAIAHMSDPQPEYYLERARALTRSGGDALASLEEGIAKLGPAVTLQMAALDLEVGSRKFAAALQRVDRLIATSERKENWLARKGDILVEAGRTPDAKLAYADALAAVAALPERIAATDPMMALGSRLKTFLQSNP